MCCDEGIGQMEVNARIYSCHSIYPFFPSSFFVHFSFFTHSLKIYPILDTKIGLEEMEVNMNTHLG